MDPALKELMDGGGEDEIEAIVHLDPEGSVPPHVRVIARFGEIATVRLPRERIAEIWADESVVSLKAPRPFGLDPDPLPPETASAAEDVEEETDDRRRPEALDATGRGAIVAVLDWGFDFAHPNFRNRDGSTRALALWDQSAPGPGPEPYGYGRVYTREEIDRALRNDEPYRALGYHPASGDPTGRGAHGTHVLDIAAGNGRAEGAPAGMAPEADLLFVHLATRGTEGRANLGDSVTLLEALDWVARQAGDRPWVVNLSVGRHGGPHTGLTLVERGIDALLDAAPGRAVVHSTGNYYAAQVHASGHLRLGQERTLRWCTDQADVTPNELEVWYPGPDVFDLEVRSPDGEAEVRVPLGGQTSIEAGGREVGRAYHRAKDPGNGDNHVDIFLYREAPAGCWQVTLIGEDVVDGRFHAWVERDAGCPSCQSRFDPGDADPATTTGTIANGFRSITVGAYDAHSPDGPLGVFSSGGPTRDGRFKPDLLAPGVGVLAARSASLELGSDTPLLTRNSGTSMAAPHVTGTVALMFEVAARPLTIRETRKLLLSTTREVRLEGEPAPRLGSGYLDVERAVEAARSFAVLPGRESTEDAPAAETALDDTDQEDSMHQHHGPCSCGSAREDFAVQAEEEATEALVDLYDEDWESEPEDEPAEAFAEAWDPATELLELADEVAAAGPGASLLDRVLVRAESAGTSEVEAGSWWGPSLSPVTLFDAVLAGGALRNHFEAAFEILALPGETPLEPPSGGDLLVRRGLGEGGIGHVAMVAAGGTWAAEDLAGAGLAGEAARPGEFVQVVEGGFQPHGRSDGFARLALDPAGRLPFDQILLRPRTARAEALETDLDTVAAPPAGPIEIRELMHPAIDVDAQRALRRMSLADEAASRDANGMFAAVKSGELVGIYVVSQEVPARRARRMGSDWWRLIPEGEDSALILEAGEPVTPPPVGERAPLIAFRASIASQPARLDAALRKAWESFQQLRGGELVCELPGRPGSTAASAEREPLPGVLANVIPLLCQLRRPQARPPRPRRPRPVPQVAADPWATADSLGNVLLFPERRRQPTRNEPLAHLQGGLFTDASLRPRVSAILGPGATPRGLAGLLRPLYMAATPGQGQGPAPTEEELARAILVYSELYLPLLDMRNWRDGLRLPLPIEIDVQSGDWILNSNLARLWAQSFPAGRQAELARRPAHLEQPDEAALTAEVQAFLQAQPDPLARGIALLARVLTNPFEAVFFFFEVLQTLGAAAFEVMLALLDSSVNHQMELLASLTAGNAILRRMLRVLEAPPPVVLSAAQQASLDSGLRRVRGALGVGATLATPRELPETAQQRARRPGGRPAGGALPRDPVEGEHRMVLGRDVLVGVVDTFTQRDGTQFTGPAYVGRIPPRPFFVAHRTDARFPQADARFDARVEIVLSIAGNEGLLDAIRMQDAGILSTGIQQWSAHADLELPGFLHRFKTLAPDEFMLFFGLYGLEVRQNGASFMLQRVQPNGTVVDLPIRDRRGFFGGARTGNRITFRTDWAGRVREASVASVAYKQAQILQGAARFDRILAAVGQLNVTLAGRRRRLPLNQVITSQLGAALILDSHINLPGFVPNDLQAAAAAAGNQPNNDRLDREITTAYATRRHTINRTDRNAFILGLGLNRAHGSFAGW